jgi:hypothetical protein
MLTATSNKSAGMQAVRLRDESVAAPEAQSARPICRNGRSDFLLNFFHKVAPVHCLEVGRMICSMSVLQ